MGEYASHFVLTDLSEQVVDVLVKILCRFVDNEEGRLSVRIRDSGAFHDRAEDKGDEQPPEMGRRGFEEILRRINENDRASVQLFEEIEAGFRSGKDSFHRRIFEDRVEAIADLLFGLMECLLSEVTLKKFALDGGQLLDCLLVRSRILHESPAGERSG